LYIPYCIVCQSGKSSISNHFLLYLPVFCLCLSELSSTSHHAHHTSKDIPRSPHTSLPSTYNFNDLPNEHLTAVDRSDPSVAYPGVPCCPSRSVDRFAVRLCRRLRSGPRAPLGQEKVQENRAKASERSPSTPVLPAVLSLPPTHLITNTTLAGVAQSVERVALTTAKRSTSRSWVRAPPSAIPISKLNQSSCSFCLSLLEDHWLFWCSHVVLGLVVELFGCCSGIVHEG
jgi:hypothetical protein